MPALNSRSGPAATIIATIVFAVVINLVIYIIGNIAGASYDFTDGGKSYRVTPHTLIGFTAIPLGIGLVATAVLSRFWNVVIPAAMIIAPVAAIGTIFMMTIPSDLDTTSKIALATAHIALGIVAVGGVLALRPARRRSSFRFA